MQLPSLLIPSKKTQNVVITLSYLIGALLITGWLKIDNTVAINTLWVIAAVGGVAIGGQAYSDKQSGGSEDTPEIDVTDLDPPRQQQPGAKIPNR